MYGDQGNGSSGVSSRTIRRVPRHALEFFAPWFFSESTRYARDYIEKGFRAITKGMSETDVRSKLDNPLYVRRVDSTTVWYYSERQDQRDNYVIRNVVFDSGGHVVERQAEFYFD
jgi:hypothetical protein